MSDQPLHMTASTDSDVDFNSRFSHGHVAPGFEGVRYEFERNFSLRGELGAAVAVYHRGELVVDLWGGHLNRKRSAAWQADTLTTIFSTTKGIAALTLALAHSRGLFEWDVPVADYWPEFAASGKQEITVRQLLGHQAGLAAIDHPLDLEILADLDRFATILAAQTPAWEPGTRHGYHATSLGWFQSELLRRVDPDHRSLGRYFREELAQPLGLDIHVGLPPDFPESRIARIEPTPLRRMIRLIGKRDAVPPRMLLSMLKGKSHTRRAFPLPDSPSPSSSESKDRNSKGPVALNSNPAMRAVEIPSANGIADARSIAKLYGIFANGGTEIGLRKETLEDLMAKAVIPSQGMRDLVLHTDWQYSLGFLKPHAGLDFASSMHAFGTPGAGGSFGYADPDARLGFAYVMNQMDGYLFNDPREKALRDAVYRSVSKLGPGQ